MFQFATNTSVIDAIPSASTCIRPTQIQYFLSYSIVLTRSQEATPHLLASCLWPMEHPLRSSIGKPVEIWCKDLFEPSSANVMIPVNAFVERVIISTDIISDEQVLITIPLI